MSEGIICGDWGEYFILRSELITIYYTSHLKGMIFGKRTMNNNNIKKPNPTSTPTLQPHSPQFPTTKITTWNINFQFWFLNFLIF